MRKSPLLLFASALALSACGTSQTNNNTAQEQVKGTEAGIQTSWMDKSVTPGDDF
jgi:uncharacterized protein YceK